MRANEFIVEGRGLYARSPSDPPFTAVAGNPMGVEVGEPYAFQDVRSFPEKGAYGNREELAAAKEDIEQQLGDIIWVNNPTARTLAFAVAEFQGVDNGQKIHYGKYFAEITTSMFGKWDNKEVPGLQPELAASKKDRAGFKPQQVLGAVATFKNGVELLRYINSVPTVIPEIKQGLNMFSEGKLPVFVDQKANLPAIRDNLGEIIQALACTYGLVGGEAEQARQAVLNGADWDEMAIHFPPGQNEGLVDFFLRAGNFSIGVSSKGKKGANASVRNLADGLRKAREAGQDLSEDYPYAAEIVQIINSNSMVEGPLLLAVEFNLITEPQAVQVADMCKQRPTTITPDMKWIKPWIATIDAKPTQGQNYGHWTLAAIARKVAEIINSDSEFSKGCIQFLNYSSMMQLYTDAGAKGDDVLITGLRAVYPPNFQGSIEMDAGKNYYTSDVKGRLSFKFSPKK